uniref:Charged multivesicular body protein 1b n=1 Tax=Xenopus tropicalis TaxID=8364 RepID=A0A803K3F2_XENTR
MSSMEKNLFNLKFAAKELHRNAKKCEKEEKTEKAKIKKAIQKGNTEIARIHAENAIRQKNQGINFLRMSARVDAVAARVQTAVTMGKVTKSMAGVVKSMDTTLKSMNLEKISALMDKFEHQFETLDVQTQQMEDTMSNTTTLTTPQNQVDNLLHEMADEAGMSYRKDWPVCVIKCRKDTSFSISAFLHFTCTYMQCIVWDIFLCVSRSITAFNNST